ncbi:ankyrin repeat domain-containing protein, partial [Methanocaldococcus sp. FS406-22]|uniref:ankyrin repeat domain-containing protein n=1 Tax=Methanocaldococcus sp. (strain FS406-22) TaxID=644281 RepID=UPI0001BF09A4
MDLDAELIMACQEGDVEKVKELIKKGANVNAKNRFGGTPLQAAVVGNHIEVVKLLIENGADLNVRNRLGVCPM